MNAMKSEIFISKSFNRLVTKKMNVIERMMSSEIGNGFSFCSRACSFLFYLFSVDQMRNFLLICVSDASSHRLFSTYLTLSFSVDQNQARRFDCEIFFSTISKRVFAAADQSLLFVNLKRMQTFHVYLLYLTSPIFSAQPLTLFQFQLSFPDLVVLVHQPFSCHRQCYCHPRISSFLLLLPCFDRSLSWYQHELLLLAFRLWTELQEATSSAIPSISLFSPLCEHVSTLFSSGPSQPIFPRVCVLEVLGQRRHQPGICR